MTGVTTGGIIEITDAAGMIAETGIIITAIEAIVKGVLDIAGTMTVYGTR